MRNDTAFTIRHLLLEPNMVSWLVAMVTASFMLRSSALLYVFISKTTQSRPVLILQDMSDGTFASMVSTWYSGVDRNLLVELFFTSFFILEFFFLGTLIFNCFYFLVSEIVPSLFACYVLRGRIFGEEHDMMLERALLPDGMEIDPEEIILEEPVGAGAYGTVFSGSKWSHNLQRAQTLE